MESRAPQLTLGLLPDSRTPWEKFLLSYGIQTAVCAFFLVAALLHPEVLVLPVHDYHFVHLVETPAPVPQTPQPVVRHLPVPKTDEIVPVRPEALRVPPELRAKKVVEPETPTPKVTMAAKLDPLPDSKPFMPRQPVKTNVFSSGSSATPTIAANPKKVQTGGFGDPNGVANRDNNGRPITIAQRGSYDLPAGPGYGNGTGGAKGVPGVVASAGFGNGVAVSDGKVSASRGTVRQAGFGDADVIATPQPKPRSSDAAVKTIPAEITYKPRPVYSDEARRLKIEGEVLVKVIFKASGQIHILGVVQGLGHGLDESAIRAAEKIQFKPALKDGQPADFEAVLHIVFELA